MTDSALQARNLHFSYSDRAVLAGLDLDIPEGSLFAIVGPNGSGKTTLVRLLAGLLRPERGSVLLRGRDMHGIPPREAARHLAFVPQDLPANLPFTVRQTVLMARAPHQGLLGLESGADRTIMEQALRTTGVAGLRHRLLEQLSGGERQRVFIARALCQEAGIMLLDEPTAALDYAYQLQILELLAGLCRDSAVTVVMVSHDLNLTSQFADRVLVLNKGEAVACGSPAEVLRRDVLEPVYGCPFAIDTPDGSRHPRISPMRE
jgi:iron complex transport system ATP-binding protein